MEYKFHFSLVVEYSDLRLNGSNHTKKLSGELDELSKKWFGQPLPEFTAL